MGKKKNKRTSKKNNNWIPPKRASSYFLATSDDEFKRKHPIGYVFLVTLGLVALMLPVILYLVFVIPLDINSPWLMLGWVGAFVIGIGLFNFVAIIIKQYLGHLVSILSFGIGSVLIWLSLVLMGVI